MIEFARTAFDLVFSVTSEVAKKLFLFAAAMTFIVLGTILAIITAIVH